MTKFQADISNHLRLKCSPRRSVFAIFPHILGIPQKFVRNKCKYQIFINKWLDKAIQKIKLHVISNVSWNLIKKYVKLQILWFAEHRSILPFLAIFFICVFWPRKGFPAVIFMLSTFRVGLKKNVKQQLNFDQKSCIKWVEMLWKKYRLLNCAVRPFCLRFWKWNFADVAPLTSHKKKLSLQSLLYFQFLLFGIDIIR